MPIIVILVNCKSRDPTLLPPELTAKEQHEVDIKTGRSNKASELGLLRIRRAPPAWPGGPIIGYRLFKDKM
jgi:hypothetical protein